MGRSRSDAGLVMIADDDEDQRIELCFFARRLGYPTMNFASGEELLGAMVEHTPQLILLDINLPARDGIRIAELASGLDHRVHICFLSGSALRLREAEIRQLGTVLSKPLSFETFRHLLPAAV
jgi:CheY-like chemotaxis protein